ncbi:hypothetical protein [Bernardetia sp.]|uniref:hypothetical protein n=1 Tax=Bernardetia sp. TaxID=1937974 RepID=UPI0025BD086F|nr:hypothetical protein [Bernardetia sp.]
MLENDLPCECYTKITSINIDSNYVNIFGGGIEPMNFPYEIRNDTLFPATDDEDKNSMLEFIKNEFTNYIVLKKDTLKVHNKNKEIILKALNKVQYDSLDVYDFQHKLNIDFLVKRIDDKDFISNLEIDQNTSLSCHPSMGVNFIWNNPPQKHWIIEKDQDSLAVYQDLTSEKLLPHMEVKKKFYKKYKMK